MSSETTELRLRRIAYLTGEYPKVSHTFILREAEALRQNGMEVLTCSIRRVESEHLTGPEEIAAEASTFYVLEKVRNPLRLLSAHAGMLIASPKRYLDAVRLAWSTRPPGTRATLKQVFYFLEAGILAREFRHRRIDHLHNHFADSSCSVAMLTSVMSGIPYSFMMHGPAVFFEAEKWRLDEKIARASFVACISNFCRSQGMIWADPKHWAKMHIVHCGVEPHRYGREDRPIGKTLIFVGRLAAVKGVPVLLDAMAKLHAVDPEVRLVLVGDGSERLAIEARIVELGLKEAVTITGYLSQGDVAKQLSQADIFTLPSFAEGVPVVLMEAMATGLPVVTTRIAGISELVEDGVGGYLAPPGNPDELASRLEILLNDSELSQRMGQAGRRQIIEAFDINKEAGRLEVLLNSYLNNAEPPELRPVL